MDMIESNIKLPCGITLKNRIAKSAMSEAMGTADNKVNSKFSTLYGKWANGGAGLLITGNIMIDPNALGEYGNIVFKEGIICEEVKHWTKAGTQNNTHLWAQLNHPGKQSPKFLSREPVAPSAIALGASLQRFFNKPKALEQIEIQQLILRFATAAKIAKDSGFTGVQIHGAHGYLVSQFLSPLHNQRKDEWGGSLSNRMRFVIEVYKAIRNEVGSNFPVSIKMNSADFQNGGFSPEESIEVAATLSNLGMDLIEISGGTYEAPQMTGLNRRKSTIAREAYFLDYCEKIRFHVKTPLMLTGGFRSLEGMESALASKACDVIGLARSMAINPNFPNDLLSANSSVSSVKPLTTGFQKIDRLFPLEVLWYSSQLRRMGNGLDPDPNLSVLGSVLSTLWNIGFQSLRQVRAKS